MLSRIFSNSMTCESVRNRFSEYIDGMLAESQRVDVHEHLKFCQRCSEHLDQYCKMVAMLVDFREELPEGIRDYRLPRATFVEIFPTIQQEPPPITVTMLAPYFSALLLFLMLLTTWDSVERHLFKELYNDSNYIQVVAKA